MANPHNLSVNLSHTGPATTQTSPNAIPVVSASEPVNQSPLDLNFSQKVSQNLAKIGDETLQQKGQETAPTTSPPPAIPNGETTNRATESPPKAPVEGAVKGGSHSSQKSPSHWSFEEIMALIDAKKAQAEKADVGSRRSRSSNAGKWGDIADFCKSQGAKKQPSQCRDKWKRLWPAFKKIMDWERQLPEAGISYWAMSEDGRDQEGFPRHFDKEIYDAMFTCFASVTPQNMSALEVNTPCDDIVEASTHNGHSAHEHGPLIDDAGPSSSGRKRKNPPRSCTLKKPATRKVLEANGGTYTPKYSKNMPLSNDVNLTLDPEERRMMLEERKLKLGERRFMLEEKKLEATIEIGKGLIASMERMTNMISSLGAHTAPC